MHKETYRIALDRVLGFAADHTDAAGRVVIDGEVDCKDSGWLILSGVIRGLDAGWDLDGRDLLRACRQWTRASTDVDDTRSAWTTFALLYAIWLSGGREGVFYQSLSTEEQALAQRFILQVDMRFLLEASRNYHVAAALIETLRVRLGFRDAADVGEKPDAWVKVMLDAYLGDGFFNDDDTRGSSADRRIDGYSAEIIGLLLHYDEIQGERSRWHGRILEIVRDFCASGLCLLDAHGEFAKWGRSLRGEAEVKKCFLWEYAESHGLTARPGDGTAAAGALFRFFEQTGIGAAGQVSKDKAGNTGIWDEYTTHVQAQGYGAYGLAMAMRMASGDVAATTLPAECESFVRYLPGPKLMVGNDSSTGLHYVVPLSNRLTKLMFLWHNRITGENDVEVDMSPKFMPIPYFGRELPAPYADPWIPFLPLLDTEDGNVLVPRNLSPMPKDPVVTKTEVKAFQLFHYCRPRQFEPASPVVLHSEMRCRSDGIEWRWTFEGPAEKLHVMTRVYTGRTDRQAHGASAEIRHAARSIHWTLEGATPQWIEEAGGPSIYGASTPALAVRFETLPGTAVRSALRWAAR